MSDPATHSGDPPKRSTTGAIPLNWAMPAELSANAAGLVPPPVLPNVQAAEVRSPAGRAVKALLLSISLGLVVGVFFDDIVGSIRSALARSDSRVASRLAVLLSPERDSAETSAPHASVGALPVDGAPASVSRAAMYPAGSGDMAAVDAPSPDRVSAGAEPETSDPAVPHVDADHGLEARGVDFGAFNDVIEEVKAHDRVVERPHGEPIDEAPAAFAATGVKEHDQASTPPVSPRGTDADSAKTPSQNEVPTEQVVRLNELPVRKKVRQMVTKAEGLIKSGRHDDAVLLLQRAELVDGSYPLLHRTRGIAEASRGQPDAARTAYRRYLKLAPNAPDAADVRRILGE
jgi:hypothetical protein